MRIEDLRPPANVPAGMNPLVVMSLAYMLRATLEDPEPIGVVREDGGWRIRDGRHRLVASMIAGRSDVLAREVAF